MRGIAKQYNDCIEIRVIGNDGLVSEIVELDSLEVERVQKTKAQADDEDWPIERVMFMQGTSYLQ